MKLTDYPSPSVTADCVVFGITFASDGPALRVLLIERGEARSRVRWRCPGGFVRMDETVDDAARRELREETGLGDVFLEQLYTFGALDRDPRGRVVSVAYYALVNLADHRVQSGTDARDARWFAVRTRAASPSTTTASSRWRSSACAPRFATNRSASRCCRERSSSRSCRRLYEAILGRAARQAELPQALPGDGAPDPGRRGARRAPPRGAPLPLRQRRYESLRRSGFDFEI